MYEFKKSKYRNHDFHQLNEAEMMRWQERVAICMVDGRLSETQAQAIAWQEIERTRIAI